MKSRERRQHYKSLFKRAPRPNRAIKSKQQQQYRAREIRDASFAFESAPSSFDNSQARETRRRKATSEGAHRPTKFNGSCGPYFCKWRSSAHICKPVSSSSSADSHQTQEDQTYCNTIFFSQRHFLPSPPRIKPSKLCSRQPLFQLFFDIATQASLQVIYL